MSEQTTPLTPQAPGLTPDAPKKFFLKDGREINTDLITVIVREIKTEGKVLAPEDYQALIAYVRQGRKEAAPAEKKKKSDTPKATKAAKTKVDMNFLLNMDLS